MNYLESVLDEIQENNHKAIIILAGDFNQLDHSNILSFGLFANVYLPTHKGHYLDRIYTSQPLYNNTKIVQSTVTTEHKAIIARSDDSVISDINKKSTTFQIRKRSPSQHAALLQYLQQYNWNNVYNTEDIEFATSTFYHSVNTIMDTFYPIRSVTVTSRDPYFITPEIKQLLRNKNKIMKQNRIERANVISNRIRQLITEHNSIRFKNLNCRSDSADLWKNIREINGTNKNSQLSVKGPFTAEQLNLHFSNISNDNNYTVSSCKSTVLCNNAHCIFDEMTVFSSLDNLKSTSSGPDGLPSWFLRLAAPCIAKPITFLFNMSLFSGIVPSQWKSSVITTIPKIPQPKICSDFRPISLTPIILRILDKLVVRKFLYPLFESERCSQFYRDQYAFRPTGSTDAAIISILDHVSTLLCNSDYVRVIALDFSKAFDTVRHSEILDKLAKLPLDDQIYNWFVNYFKDHNHRTKFDNNISSTANINCSVFQGSAVGPPLFLLNGLDLKPQHCNNFIDKYADDTYLIISASNEHTIDDELRYIEFWANKNNLKLNTAKSQEIVFFAKPKNRILVNGVKPVSNIPRVSSLKILGVTISENFSVSQHVQNCCESAGQSLYAIKTLKQHGLDSNTVNTVCRTTVASRLTYASPAWWRFATVQDKLRLQSVLNRAKRWGFYRSDSPTIEQICGNQDTTLFTRVLSNPFHVLYHSLPPEKPVIYKLRNRAHNRQIPFKASALLCKNFLFRLLYKDSY